MNVVSSYIHYHYWNYNGSKGMLDPNQIREQVKNKFLQNFAIQQKEKYGTTFSSESQIKQLLRDMSSNGVIGQKLVDEIEKLNWQDGISKVQTGTGFSDLKVDKDSGPVKIPEKAAEILKIANEKINGLIEVLKDSKQYILLNDLKQALSGTAVDDLFQGLDVTVPDGEITFDMLSASDIQVQKSLDSIAEKLNLVSAGGEMSAKDFNSFLTSLTSVFSSVGGLMYEPVVNQAANIVKYKMDQVIDNTNAEMASPITRIISSTHTGTAKIDSKDVKPDIVLTASINGVIVDFGGSIKLRQSKEVLNTKKLPKIDLVSEGWTLGRMLEEGHKFAGAMNLFPYYEAGFGAIYGGKESDGFFKPTNSKAYSDNKGWETSAYSALSDAWEKAKEGSKYVMALHVLSGSGSSFQKNGAIFRDTASILIINNKIYSVYDILKVITNGLDKFMHVTEGPGFQGYRSYIVSQIREDSLKYHTWEEYYKRSNDTIDLIQKLYDKKIRMSLNFNYYNLTNI